MDTDATRMHTDKTKAFLIGVHRWLICLYLDARRFPDLRSPEFNMPRHLSPQGRQSAALFIAGPPFVIAALFLVNWLKRTELHARREGGRYGGRGGEGGGGG